MELGAIGGSQPSVLNSQIARMPIASQAAGIIRKENKTRFENAHQDQHQDVTDKCVNQQAQHSWRMGTAVTAGESLMNPRHCSARNSRNGWREWGGIGYNYRLA